MKWIQSEIMCPIADVDQSLVSGHNEDEQFLENAKKIKVDNDFNSFLNPLKRKFTNIANIPKKFNYLITSLILGVNSSLLNFLDQNAVKNMLEKFPR